MECSFFVSAKRAFPVFGERRCRVAPVLAVASALLAACAAPGGRPPVLPVTVAPLDGAGEAPDAAAAFVAGPDAAYARAREEQRRGIGIPPALPPPGAVDRVAGTLRASRPAPGTGPSGRPPSLPVPSNSLSRLSALPASPLANPPGGFALGRP
jgi:hypothetical protein